MIRDNLVSGERTAVHFFRVVHRGDDMPESMLLRLDPAILREVRKRARAENRTPAQYVETAVREKLQRTPVAVIVHPSLRKTIRKSKAVRAPRESKKDRAARERLHHLVLDAAGIPR